MVGNVKTSYTCWQVTRSITVMNCVLPFGLRSEGWGYRGGDKHDFVSVSVTNATVRTLARY